ncbi:2165_t:CDS:2 [Diversispora eburnea]|uniref:2165_t:CDS:1 n=1 Tax=Diversispora eburnea TaxID=1213867 RepID=A0A9N8YQ07_9GLOM|nr:2165_t:CDS:2 [Diversispora eburnea]
MHLLNQRNQQPQQPQQPQLPLQAQEPLQSQESLQAQQPLQPQQIDWLALEEDKENVAFVAQQQQQLVELTYEQQRLYYIQKYEEFINYSDRYYAIAQYVPLDHLMNEEECRSPEPHILLFKRERDFQKKYPQPEPEPGVRVPLKPVNLLKPVNPTIISTIRSKIPGHIPRQVGFLRQYATTTVKKTKPDPKKKSTVRSVKIVKGVRSVKGVKSVKSKPKVTVKKKPVKVAPKKKIKAKIWNQRYQEAKAKYLIDFKNWQESLTPEQYRLENRRRRLLSKKKGKKVSLLKDPKAPKKPKTPYMLFLTSVMDDFRDLKVTERSKEAAKRWNELKPEDKKPYEELYLKDQARYKAEAEKYKKLYA